MVVFLAVQTVNENSPKIDFYELLMDPVPEKNGEVYFHTPTGDVFRQNPDGSHVVEWVDPKALGPKERAWVDGNLASWRPDAGKAFVRLVVRRQ